MAKRRGIDLSVVDDEADEPGPSKRHHYSSHYKLEWERDSTVKNWVSYIRIYNTVTVKAWSIVA